MRINLRFDLSRTRQSQVDTLSPQSRPTIESPQTCGEIADYIIADYVIQNFSVFWTHFGIA